MTETSNTIIEQEPSCGLSWLPTGLGAIDALWGFGAPSNGMCELHSGMGKDMTKVALQLAAGVVRGGQNVAFFDVARNVTHDLEHEFIWSKGVDGTDGWGQFDVFCPSTFGQAMNMLGSVNMADVLYPLIIIDSFSSIEQDLHPTNGQNPHILSGDEPWEAAQIRFLKYCKEHIVADYNSVVVLNPVDANTSPTDFPSSPEGSKQLDAMFDIRTAIAPWDMLPVAGDRKALVSPPDLAAWNTHDYRACPNTIVPLIKGVDGCIDDALSLAALLIQHGEITQEGESFTIQKYAETINGFDQLIEWIVTDHIRVRNLAAPVASE